MKNQGTRRSLSAQFIHFSSESAGDAVEAAGFEADGEDVVAGSVLEQPARKTEYKAARAYTFMLGLSSALDGDRLRAAR
ncbi:hypothetical protein LVJ94_05175 [Pendulispora rubella]|uniref:Uncharacterized protein n=1 Tax=Pendulispora rubella TaxID=2741070 RepID=A0ABZ2L6S1_9BACT